MKSFEFKSEGLILWCGRIASLVGSNLLWILCCLPVVTAGAATKALYYNMYRLSQGEECGAKTFFRAFRDQFLRTTVIFLVIAAAALFFGWDYYLVAYMDFPGRMAVIGLIFFAAFLLLFVSSVIFPMMSQFDLTVRDAAVNAVLLSIANLTKVFLVSAMNLLPWVLLLVSTKWFLMLGIFWLLGGFALIALYNAKILDRIFSRFRTDQD